MISQNEFPPNIRCLKYVLDVIKYHTSNGPEGPIYSKYVYPALCLVACLFQHHVSPWNPLRFTPLHIILLFSQRKLMKYQLLEHLWDIKHTAMWIVLFVMFCKYLMFYFSIITHINIAFCKLPLYLQTNLVTKLKWVNKLLLHSVWSNNSLHHIILRYSKCHQSFFKCLFPAQ